jgi:hypothetical protein
VEIDKSLSDSNDRGIESLVHSVVIPAYMMVRLLLGASHLITIGLLGEYIGRMFAEAKQRPLCFIRSYNFADVGQ